MVEMFKAKVRNVGTSLGILLPRRVIIEENIQVGEEIDVSILKERIKLIEDSFGIDKGTSKFKRENKDRINRWRNASG